MLRPQVLEGTCKLGQKVAVVHCRTSQKDCMKNVFSLLLVGERLGLGVDRHSYLALGSQAGYHSKSQCFLEMVRLSSFCLVHTSGGLHNPVYKYSELRPGLFLPAVTTSA